MWHHMHGIWTVVIDESTLPIVNFFLFWIEQIILVFNTPMRIS